MQSQIPPLQPTARRPTQIFQFLCEASQTRPELDHPHNLFPIDVNKYRHGKEKHTQKSQQARCPFHIQHMIHARHKHREAATCQTPYERVPRDCAVPIHQIHINDVGQPLQENHRHTGSNRYACQYLQHPRNVRRRRPSEPEKPDRKQKGADDHRYQTLFGDRLAVIFKQFALVRSLRGVSDGGDADYHTDQDGQEGESSNAGIPAASFLERYWVGEEER